MNFYFFDSSAIVKNYITEAGSDWVKQIFNAISTDVIYAASITQVEVVAAFARQRKGLKLSVIDATTAISQFNQDFQSDIREIELKSNVLSEAVLLAEKYSLRGYDAVQLASALKIHTHLINLKIDFNSSPFTFVSADGELNTAALSAGLAVENPNSYP